MTTSIFLSTQLKATLLGSLWAIVGRPDPAKLLEAIWIRESKSKEVFWKIRKRMKN